MAGKTLIGGTAYKITGGKAMINGASHKVTGGKAMTGGTVYSIKFSKNPKLSEVLADMAVKKVEYRNSSSASTTLPVLTYEDGDYILVFFKDKMTLMRDDQRDNVFDVNGGVELTFDFSVPSVKIDNSVEDSVYGATIMSVRFPNFNIDEVRSAFSTASVVKSSGRNTYSSKNLSMSSSGVLTGDFIFCAASGYRKLNVMGKSSPAVFNWMGETNDYTHLTTSGSSFVFTGNSAGTALKPYGGTIIALRGN